MSDEKEARQSLLSPHDQYGSEDLHHNSSYNSFPRITPEMAADDQWPHPVPVQENPPVIMRVYKRRWYILIIWSLFAFTQDCIWNTWGPISTTSEEAFGWQDSTVAWLNNWGPVSYVISGLMWPWFLQVKGLRWATLSSMFLVALGTACRVITSHPPTATILIHIGQFLNGLAGPIAMGGIPTLSATWFPPQERVMATAIGTTITVFGAAVPYVLGPALVSGGPNKTVSTTTTTTTTPHPNMTSANVDYLDYVMEHPNVTDARIHKERQEIMWYMYLECGWAVLLLIVLLVYFPAKPPLPPCVSAAVERDKYWRGMLSLLFNVYFQIVAISYAISTGVLNCWSSVLTINLKAIDVSQNKAGWIGFWATNSSAVCGTLSSLLVFLVVLRLPHLFAVFTKMYILLLYVLGTGCLLVFALMLDNKIPYSNALLWFTIIGGNTLVNAAVPMMYELACELAYPTSEGAANGYLTLFNNIWGLIFLVMFSFPHIGTMWMNWTVIGSTAICIPLIAMLRGRFNRLEVDEGVHTEVYVEQVVDVPREHAIQTD